LNLMKYIKNTLIFIYLLALHVELVCIFSISYYFLYFINLIIILYFINSKILNISLSSLFVFSGVTLVLINLEIYNEVIFELFLYLNILDKVIYINSEIMYVLALVHLLLFINLKKFDNFWDIIDKKVI